MEDTDLFLVNRDDTNYKQTKDELMAKLLDTDLLLVNRDDKNYKITGAEFKATFEGKIVVSPSISSSSDYPPSTLTATIATVTNAQKDPTYDNWFKDDVAIAGTAEQLTYEATEPGVYFYQERWVGGDSSELKPTSSSVTINQSVIATPTVLTPGNNAGMGGGNRFYAKTAKINSSTIIENGGYADSPDGSGANSHAWRAVAQGVDENGDEVWVAVSEMDGSSQGNKAHYVGK